jgi:hypothetical protein
MKNIIFFGLILFGGISQANAQISYLSKPRKGSNYVEPYDRDVVRQAMQYKQQIYDNNLSKIKNMVKSINTEILDLNKVNHNEAIKVNKKFMELLGFLNQENLDYSNDNSFRYVMNSLNSCMEDVLSRYNK